jgi:hypothetical protein
VIHSTFGGKELRQRPLQPIRLPQIAMGGPKERQSITGRGLGPQVNGMTNHKFNESTTLYINEKAREYTSKSRTKRRNYRVEKKITS